MTHGKSAHDVLRAARKLATAQARVSLLGEAIAEVDKPKKLVEPLCVALRDSEANEDVGSRLEAMCAPRGPAVLAKAGHVLDSYYFEVDAVRVLRRAIAEGARDKTTIETLGRLATLHGDASGVPLLEQAIQRWPEWPAPRNALALWFAERDRGRALELVSDDGDAYTLEIRSMVLAASGKPRLAHRALAQAVEWFDDEVTAVMTFSRWHHDENRFDRALVLARRLHSELRSSTTITAADRATLEETVVQAFRQGGAFGELIPHLRRLVEADVTSYLASEIYDGVMNTHPIVEPNLGWFAARVAERLCLRDNDAAQARLWRIRAAAIDGVMGKLEGLVNLAATGLDGDPAAWVELSRAYDSAKSYDAAHAALDRALELAPASGEALSQLFFLANTAGDLGAMERAADAIAVRCPSWHQGREFRARVNARRGDGTSALRDATDAIGLAPYCPNAWTAVAEAAITLGDRARARDAVRHAERLGGVEPDDDTALVAASVARDPRALEAALAARFGHLASLPFGEFVARLRSFARSAG